MHEILIVEDHRMFGLALSELLSQYFSASRINVLHTLKDAVFYIKNHSIDILICDLNLNGEDGFDVFRLCRHELCQSQIIVLSAYFEQHLIAKAQKLNVNAFIPKETAFAELLDVMKEPEKHTFAPKYLLPKEIENNSIGDSFSNSQILSNREKDIIRFLAEGLLSKEIADKLGLAKLTIDTHRKNIRKKLGLKTLGEIIRFAHANKLID
jgi:DNA-binding NarL/FixJ family response regulator